MHPHSFQSKRDEGGDDPHRSRDIEVARRPRHRKCPPWQLTAAEKVRRHTFGRLSLHCETDAHDRGEIQDDDDLVDR